MSRSPSFDTRAWPLLEKFWPALDRMEYDSETSDLTISGKVPIAGSAESTGSEKKKCNRGIRADAERQREHCHRRESRALRQRADGESEVLEHVLLFVPQGSDGLDAHGAA